MSIYGGINGTIVHERTASRKIEFTTDCFHKDSERALGDLSDVLGQGDEATLVYMVNWTCRDEGVYRVLVWQGDKPQPFPGLDPDEFARI